MDENKERVVYELGFHLIPLVTEDEVAAHVTHIKSVLDKAGAEIISEAYPEMIELAYDISKTIGGTREDFSTAHFGWIKFTAESSAIEEIDEALRSYTEILRFIIVKTLEGDTLLFEQFGGEDDEDDDQSKGSGEADKKPESEGEGDKKPKKDLDAEIDELVVE